MSSTFTTAKVLEKQATGENENTWGTNLNTALDAIDACFGRTSLSVAGSADVTLTTAQARPIIQEYTGVLTGNINVIVPTLPAVYIVYNNTTGSFTLTVKTSGGTGIAVTQATRTIVYCDETNVVSVLSTSSYLSTTGGTLTGAINGATIATVASATTCDIGAAASNAVSITGTTTITGFGTITSGTMRFIRFTGILTLTHNATSLVLPGAANITTAAGDCAIAQSLGSGNWAVLHYQRATGEQIVASFSRALGMSGAAINEAQGSDIASASTIDLDAATGNLVDVTGTTTITAVTLSQGRQRVVRFTGALTFTHGSSLVLPGAANITTAAGDFAILRGYAAGVVRCVGYFPATGMPVVAPRQIGSPTGGDKGAGTINVDGSSSLFGYYQDGNPTGLKLLSTLTASTSATLDFTATNSTIYSAYRFIIEDYLAATDATDLHMRVSTDGGSSYQAGTGYSYAFIGATSAPGTGNAGGTGASAAKMLNSLSNVAGTSGVIDVIIGGRTRMVGVLHGYQSSGVFVSIATGGEWNSSGVNAIRFLQSSGNITSGTIRVYGIPKA